jgi:hypothetical protein
MVYEWAKKQHEVDVYMRMVRWADLYVEYAITLVQQVEANPSEIGGWEVGDFVDCTWIEVCNNFECLQIDAKIGDPNDPGIIPDAAQHWYLCMNESASHGDGPLPEPSGPPPMVHDWEENETSIIVDDPNSSPGHVLNLTGTHGWVLLCVKATGVDPQRLAFNPGDPDTSALAARVYLTYYPALAPDVADFSSVNIGELPPEPGDLGSPYWDPYTGGGAGVPGDTLELNSFPNPPRY